MKIAQYTQTLTRAYLHRIGLSHYQMRRIYQKLPENSRTTTRILWREVRRVLGDKK